MSKYAYVVASCTKYLPELTALLNSLAFVGSPHDVHISGYNLPGAFLDQLETLPYTAIHHAITEPEARQYGGEGEILCRRRFYDAAVWGQDYDATCLLDADMFAIRPHDPFFDIAAGAKLIVGAALEQKRTYGAIEHQQLVDGTKLLDTPAWNEKDICCAPIFADMRTYCFAFKASWHYYQQGFKAPDMEAFNIAIMHYGLSPRILGLPNNQFVGTNEQYLKPYIRVVRQSEDPTPGSKLWTETGAPIYIAHGQFVKQRWRDQQILNRIGCSNGYLGGCRKSVELAVGALELLWTTFKQMLEYRIRIPESAYTVNGEWGSALLSFDPFKPQITSDSAALHEVVHA